MGGGRKGDKCRGHTRHTDRVNEGVDIVRDRYCQKKVLSKEVMRDGSKGSNLMYQYL